VQTRLSVMSWRQGQRLRLRSTDAVCDKTDHDVVVDDEDDVERPLVGFIRHSKSHNSLPGICVCYFVILSFTSPKAHRSELTVRVRVSTD